MMPICLHTCPISFSTFMVRLVSAWVWFERIVLVIADVINFPILSLCCLCLLLVLCSHGFQHLDQSLPDVIVGDSPVVPLHSASSPSGKHSLQYVQLQLHLILIKRDCQFLLALDGEAQRVHQGQH